MSQEAERFLQAEKSAQDVLEALSSLEQEAVSYKTSTKELHAVRQDLVGLIDSIQAVADDTHEVVKLIKAIGGPEILERVERLKILSIIGISTAMLSLVGIVFLLLR